MSNREKCLLVGRPIRDEDIVKPPYLKGHTAIGTPANIWMAHLFTRYLRELHKKRSLEDEVITLRKEVKELREILKHAPISARIVEIKDVTIEQAEQMVAQYLKTRKRAYPSEISDALSIPLKTTVEALEELQKEGKVKGL